MWMAASGRFEAHPKAISAALISMLFDTLRKFEKINHQPWKKPRLTQLPLKPFEAHPVLKVLFQCSQCSRRSRRRLSLQTSEFREGRSGIEMLILRYGVKLEGGHTRLPKGIIFWDDQGMILDLMGVPLMKVPLVPPVKYIVRMSQTPNHIQTIKHPQ